MEPEPTEDTGQEPTPTEEVAEAFEYLACAEWTTGGVLVFMADLIPSAAHIHLPWVAGFDLNPLLSVSEKRQLLSRAVEDNYLLVFQHDPVNESCRVAFTDGKFHARELGDLATVARA